MNVESCRINVICTWCKYVYRLCFFYVLLYAILAHILRTRLVFLTQSEWFRLLMMYVRVKVPSRKDN